VPPHIPVFDLCGPLPVGTTVLEASAGTGKTFTIAALATRYVAEGLAELSQLMLVTFGRAATQELRQRVH
jgi:exodeoxyribonuclease V beta subunit